MEHRRNYGLDLFRMFSMFCVIILHILGHGGALESSSNINFVTLWFWELVAMPAVDCFVLLSGFVGFRGDKIYPKISNILTIIFSTFFYSIIFFLVYKFAFIRETTLKQLIFSALPVLTKQYWFVSAYVGMFLFSPLINSFVDKAEKKTLFTALIITLVLAIYSLPKDPFGFNYGYSTIWFILLYMIGAIIKREDLLNKISVLRSAICIAIGIFILLGSKLIFSFLGVSFSALSTLLISYCSPFVLLMGIGWMAIFSKIKTPPVTNKLISFIAPSVFSVYLIHDNPYIRELFITNNFKFINSYNPIIASGIILVCALTIFIACLLIDKIRVLLFKILRISQVSLFLENKVKWLYSIIYKRIRA